ncbi:MAG: tetratricopeptide repeat protein [Sphingomonadaceae bacterium]|nr:tetratricopeptide repeat protein [Sphingomonadaceae bacterium]
MISGLQWRMAPAARLFIVVSVCVLLAVAALQETIIALTFSDAPAVAAQVSRRDARVIDALQLQMLQRRNLVVSRQMLDQGRLALNVSPLDDTPFVIFGKYALQRGDFPSATRLLEEARRRAPRGQMGRYFLLDAYLQAGNMTGAAGEIAVLVRLVPETSALLVPIIARFADDRLAGPALRKILRRDPLLRGQVLLQMVKADVDPRLILSIGGVNAPEGDIADWRSALLDRMVRRQQIPQSFAVWKRFTGLPNSKALLQDSGFRHTGQMPPFGWNLLGTGDGVAEPVRQGGIDVEYFGRGPADLARQLLVLAPGAYALSFRAMGAAGRISASISWEVECSSQPRQLVAIRVANVSPVGAITRAVFVVPSEGCSGQWLTLKGYPGEFPATLALNFSDLRLEHVR